MLCFTWWDVSNPKMVVNEPSYALAFKFWTTNKRNKGIVQIDQKLFLDQHVLAELEKSRHDKKGSLIEARFDGESPNNEIITND